VALALKKSAGYGKYMKNEKLLRIGKRKKIPFFQGGMINFTV
jgi:hypothetical protein